MKILKVIHGYPTRYNAGSEVYSQTLCHGLIEKKHKVEVFTRIEDSFSPDYALFSDRDNEQPEIRIHLVNMPRAKDGYRHQGVDDQFEKIIMSFDPDIIHIGHLNHLSTSIPMVAEKFNIPVVYTLHDYWLMCPRGQFMQMFPQSRNDLDRLWDVCDGQVDRKCALRCYLRYFSGLEETYATDLIYWKNWVGRRMDHVRTVCESIDLFIAPSRYLYDRYHKDFGISDNKMVYLDYGFDLKRFSNRKRQPDEPFTFGYIGTHIPSKGIHHLIKAFGMLTGNPQLRIWGRPRGQDTQALMALAARLPSGAGQRVQWVDEYKNQNIVEDVFNHVDAIVVPSIWVENSPLVIHEALQARVPVITANAGGMSEYVHHEKNGLLFDHRTPEMLVYQMQRLFDNPDLGFQLGERGYLNNEDSNIPDIDTHVAVIEKLYEKVLNQCKINKQKDHGGLHSIQTPIHAI
ncbi:MAG: glycosyltransferase [Desulfobacteraceae bacterium]|jgi:glycosyltransferase involved in cell wall biosynthesis